ncbi:hypothetical protein [Limosilactobacillus sp.]|uniref:hypothetical protein n=1 Tax=Limosilactobacillus sp. TaxID=2773925 RepID=UPI003F1202F0
MQKPRNTNLVANKKVKIDVENLLELKKLLKTAVKQSKQLQKTISELQHFELKVRTQVDE